MWTYLHIGMYKNISWPYQHYSRSVLVISPRGKKSTFNTWWYLKLWEVLEVLENCGVSKLKIVVLNNKIYWNTKPFMVQYNADLEIKFFNSLEMEEKAAYNIYTAQLY